MDKLFQVHRLNEGGLKNAQLIAEAFDELVMRLSLYCDPSLSPREVAIVRTKLEEAAFYAKKAMANNPSNQNQQQ